jgi:hypothetical protein
LNDVSLFVLWAAVDIQTILMHFRSFLEADAAAASTTLDRYIDVLSAHYIALLRAI